ncbi:MAG: hypothetical protein P4L40_11440 [Terracidiphilus sp.]|nr:hypothetical protein [Terracidiphilus sp.]
MQVWLFDIAPPSTTDPSPHPSQLTSVTTLTLTGCNQFAHADCLRALSACTRLRNLTWEGAEFTPDAARVLLEAIPGVHTLRLPRVTGLGEQAVMWALTRLSCLHTLDITGCRGVTDKVCAPPVDCVCVCARARCPCMVVFVKACFRFPSLAGAAATCNRPQPQRAVLAHRRPALPSWRGHRQAL